MHLCDHSYLTHPNMHHPTFHLQPTEVMTCESIAAAQFSRTSQDRGCKAAGVAQDGFCSLIDRAHVFVELAWHNRVCLYMRLSHIAKIHEHTLIHPFSISDKLTTNPSTKYRTGSENIAQCPRAVGSSLNPADQVSNPLEKNAKSQPKTNERNRRLHDPHC